MSTLRALVRDHPGIAAIVLATALLLRVLVPTGFMPTFVDGRISVGVCTGMGPAQRMTIAVPGLEHKSQAPVAEGACAFADLSLPALGGADPIQLAALIVFILALGLVLATTLPPLRAARLRPPLRGPPITF